MGRSFFKFGLGYGNTDYFHDWPSWTLHMICHSSEYYGFAETGPIILDA